MKFFITRYFQKYQAQVEAKFKLKMEENMFRISLKTIGEEKVFVLSKLFPGHQSTTAKLKEWIEQS